MLKAGKYHCKVIAPSNGWFGEAGENNTPFLRIPLEVTEEGEAQGEQITFQGWLSDKSVERTVKNLAEVFGWNGDLVALAKMTNTGPFVGKPCRIVTEEDEYNGKKKVVIKWLNAPDGGGKAMVLDKAMSLAARLAKRAETAAASALAEAPASRPAPPQKRPPSDPDLDAPEDDIPF